MQLILKLIIGDSADAWFYMEWLYRVRKGLALFVYMKALLQGFVHPFEMNAYANRINDAFHNFTRN